jgi:ribosomal protein S6--L-glutamate ligase/gamma-F420-2:alpha-L-glutamate ligase
MKEEILLSYNINSESRSYENEQWKLYGNKEGFEVRKIITDQFIFEKTVPKFQINMSQNVNDAHFRFIRKNELLGSRVINKIYYSFIADNKSLSNLEINNLTIKVPKTIDFLITNPLQMQPFLDLVEEHIGFPCILKPKNSATGIGVIKVDSRLQLKDISDLLWLSCSKFGDGLNNCNYIIQEFIKTSEARDLRIVILNGECLGGMQRVSNFDWKPRKAPVPNPQVDNTYVTYSKFIPDEELIKKCKLITQSLNINYAGLDVFFGENEYIFGEINTNPGLYRFEVCNPNIKVVPLLLDFLKNQN